MFLFVDRRSAHRTLHVYTLFPVSTLFRSLSFVVVYREVFETILFYVALWTQGNHQAVLAGAAAATVTLAVITWLLLRASTRLPIGLFFSVSAILMAVLAVVLTGKGIAALQEANVLPSQVLALPRFDLVGLYPTIQGLAL